ncbi:hypothetical protein BJX99DRAFT_269849 [Aspergillus californicus]
MAQATDPVSKTLTTPVRLGDVGENAESETPSPCASKASRVKKNGRRPTTVNDQVIREMIRRNKSPKFAALLQGPVGSFPGGASEHKDSASRQRAGDRDSPQKGTRSLPSSEPPNPNDTSEDSNNKQHTIREIFRDTKNIMTKTYKNNEGYAYILFDPLNQSRFFKIGKANNPTSRKGEHTRKCQLKGWASRERPATPIRWPMRLERLAQAELQNMKYIPDCPCGVEHVEFSGEFWVDRLKLFQSRLRDYFSCGRVQCAEEEEEVAACQACLRAGWRKWAEPTPEDELDYACRAAFSSKWVQLRALELGTFRLIKNLYLVEFINLVGGILSIWRSISHPNIFLWAIPLRILGYWVEPRFHLPGPAFLFLLLMIDIMLVIVCVYTRLRYPLEKFGYART